MLFHEIPQEHRGVGILIHGRFRVRRTVLVNLTSASTAILGVLLVLRVGASAGTVVTN